MSARIILTNFQIFLLILKVHTPGWWSDQPQNNCPEGNILAEAREALKMLFYLVDSSFQEMPHTISQLIV